MHGWLFDLTEETSVSQNTVPLATDTYSGCFGWIDGWMDLCIDIREYVAGASGCGWVGGQILVGGWMDEWIDGIIDGCVNEWMNECVIRQIDGCIDPQIPGCMDGVDGWREAYLNELMFGYNMQCMHGHGGW